MGERLMNQKESQNTSSVAWFKLANLIEKREKEKALNVFRLLTHSLRDRAYSLQLEGDILWSLDESALAHEKYVHSALLYQKDKRWIHAVSLYESLLANNPNDCTTLASVIICYGHLGWENKFKEKLDKICELIPKNISDDTQLTSAIKLLSSTAKELENNEFKAILHNKIQALLASVPKAAAEKIEFVFNKKT
jgi:hypothetical protein